MHMSVFPTVFTWQHIILWVYLSVKRKLVGACSLPGNKKKRCVCSRAICESYQPWRAWQGQKTLQLGVCACKCVCWIITATDRSLSDQGLMTLVALPEVTTHEYIWTIHYTVKHTPGCRPYSNYIWTHVLHKNTHTHWSRGDIPQMRRRGRRRSVDWEMCCTNTHTHRDKPTHLFKEVDEHTNYAPLLQLIMLHKP